MAPDPIAEAAANDSAADPTSPVPVSADPFTIAVITKVNPDGTVNASINAGAAEPPIICLNTFVPQVDQEIMIVKTGEGVTYAIGARRNNTLQPDLMNAYPVGSIYISTLSTNPADLLGFGTWVAAAQGRTLIGAGTSDQTFSNGTTGGASSRTINSSFLPLTAAWQPSDPTHVHGAPSGTTGFITDGTGTNFSGGSGGGNKPTTSPASTGVTMQSNAGGGNALPTLPPYLVVCIWQRTA